MSQLDYRFVEQARRDLTALLAENPELEEDDVLRLDMVEGQTNAMELLDQLIEAEKEALCIEDAIEREIERLTKRHLRFADRRSKIRRFMMQLMEAANLKKAERPVATVSIAAGRPKVIITDESQIPDWCIRVKREINKETIANFLKSGETVPGATLSNAEPVLRIS